MPKFEKDNEVINSDEECLENNQNHAAASSEDENETVVQKKTRIMKTYMEEIKREGINCTLYFIILIVGF